MTGGERAQALVEAVAVFPVCIFSALALVDCGVIVRDRMAIAQAASRAGAAEIAGHDVERAARQALPSSVAQSLRVRRTGHELQLTITTRPTLLGVAGGVRQTSHIALPPEVIA
jgi:hypothetical protein